MKRKNPEGMRARGLIAGLGCAALLAWPALSVASGDEASLQPRPDPGQVDAKKAELGKFLFFDTRLSGDTSRSCATCHSPEQGWADGQPLSAGYTGSDYFRNAPTVLNAAERARFMWDGRLDGKDLSTLVRDKITESHFMNADGRLVQERLKQIPEYVEMWQEIFGENSDPYGPAMFGVIGEYVKSLRSNDAPYDDYLAGNEKALSDSALRGRDVFVGKGNCASCHSGPTFSDGQFHRLGIPENPDIWSDPKRAHTALRFLATHGTPNYMNLREDVGLYAVTKSSEDVGKFITPGLRELTHTAPYMHNGVFSTLEEVVDFYDQGGGENGEIGPLDLTEQEKQDLVSFLESLSGEPVLVEAPEKFEYQLREFGVN